MRFHFISGLPRSGSTLLAALLRQNPRFSAGISSPMAAVFGNLLATFSAGGEFAPVVDETTRMRLLRGLFDSFYATAPSEGVVFDTNRAWCARLPDLLRLFPESRVLVCVRNVAWVMDSIERMYQSSAFENTRLFNDDAERNTVYSRVDTLAQRNRLVGFAWCAAKEAYFGPHADSLLFIDYELLARSPERVMPLIYQFLGEPPFEHDFASLEFAADEFDNALGVPHLHRVRPRVALEERRSLLPPDLFEIYNRWSFWLDSTGSAAHAIRIKS